MKRSILIVMVVCLTIFAMAIGYLVGSNVTQDTVTDENIDSTIDVPVWEKGMFWVYSYNTPDSGFLTSRLAMAAEEGENYMIGIDKRIDAQRHAVLNFNPMLGRIGKASLEIFEKGEPETLFHFPLETSSNWSFSMYDIEGFEAKVVSIQKLPATNNISYIVNIEATAGSGEVLTYTYDSRAQWIGSLELVRDQTPILEMKLMAHGSDFKGELFFVRGVDLFDKEYSSSRGSPTMDLYDTFIDRGHPNWGPFDELIYFFEVETGSATAGALTLRDHISTTHVRRTFDANTAESSLGVIPSEQGEWGVTVSMFGESHVRFRIAGGIEYSWTV